VAGWAAAAQPSVTQRLEPTTIGRGEAARLTIAASGTSAPAVTPPMVNGLEFVAIGQSQRVESVNGVTSATTSVTYQVIPRQAGVFTIPSLTPGSQPLVLTVQNGGAAGNANGSVNGRGAGGGQSQAAPARAAPGGSVARLSADGSAFVRLRLSKHELYVGERIPVDIEVGTRDGLVASLDGLPTLNGDAFTLDKLAAQPQRSQEMIDDQPFTVFTWHSALSAIKPGSLSLTMETPLTVRIPMARPDMRMFADEGMDDFFNDPNLQGFFGGATQKQVTVSSSPTVFDVLPLPTADRPADFSGAVGSFTLSSDLSDAKATEGDPVTLHLHVSGSGNFDRVNTRMLHDVDHWKTYAPTATFAPADEIGYRGEKTFDQPVIATQPGEQSLPPVSFSWFDPTTRRYVEAHTQPLRVAVTAAPAADTALARNANPTAGGAPDAGAVGAAPAAAADGLRPDHVDDGHAVASLLPHYYQPAYLVAPSAFLLALLGAGFWSRRRDARAGAARAARARAESLRTEPLIEQMGEAARTGNAELFLRSARLAVQRALATQWQVPPDTLTLEQIEARLGKQTELAQLFEFADEASYSRVKLSPLDFKHWQNWVMGQVSEALS